jgi:large subunit ribosomal protein L13
MSTTKEYNIDAEGKTLGRVASEVAVLLCGKDSPDYARNLVSAVKVKVANISKIKIINDKLNSRYHKHYTGHPGGMIVETNAMIAAKKGYAELLRLAVHGMLPNNKLKPLMLKNLIITE